MLSGVFQEQCLLTHKLSFTPKWWKMIFKMGGPRNSELEALYSRIITYSLIGLILSKLFICFGTHNTIQSSLSLSLSGKGFNLVYSVLLLYLLILSRKTFWVPTVPVQTPLVLHFSSTIIWSLRVICSFKLTNIISSAFIFYQKTPHKTPPIY